MITKRQRFVSLVREWRMMARTKGDAYNVCANMLSATTDDTTDEFLQVRVADIKPGDDFFNGDFKCWETCTGCDLQPDGQVRLTGPLDYMTFSPDHLLSVRRKLSRTG